ncbi:hypothetical protein AB0E63_45660 [Kribbella sp. NPDC026596]|uniref:hypothetical protein n=1 Tax=Kribbella sp. NPDC026596 TaxID=3155122 RepID=UPI00340110A2
MIWLAIFPTLTVLNLALGDWLSTMTPVLRDPRGRAVVLDPLDTRSSDVRCTAAIAFEIRIS